MTPPDANPMATTLGDDAPDTTPPQRARAILSALSGRRAGWIALAAIGIAAGLAFNWSWLVAVGVAPLLLMALPCAAMCALGVCMRRAGPQSGDPAVAKGTQALPRCAGCAGDHGQREADPKRMRP